MRFTALFAFLITLNLDAATIVASSTSRADVGTAIASAVDGDLVTIPAGNSEWTSNLTITNSITLQGAGIGNTIIRDGITLGGSPQNLISLSLVANKFSRITGIEFQQGTRTDPTGRGLLIISGLNDARRFRVDHCMFTNLSSLVFEVLTAFGVVDHNTVYAAGTAFLGYVKCASYDGSSFGDGSWAAADQLGTDQFTFFEDNILTYTGTFHATTLDAQAGGRYVFRYNTLNKGSLEGHGLESGQRERSTRAYEVYNNTFTGNDGGQIVTFFRGGTGVIYNNVISAYQGTSNPLKLLTYRSAASFTTWGGADGTNVWDVNIPGGPFASGTASSAGTLTMTVSGSPWTVNQWAGYSVQRKTNLGSLSGFDFSMISANTANTITFYTSAVGQDLQFTAGDSFQFWKVDHAMDQPGRSQGSLVTGDPPSVPGGWNDQSTSAWYEWNNTENGSIDVNFGAVHNNIRAGEHYFDNTSKPGYAAFTYPHPLVSSHGPTIIHGKAHKRGKTN